MNTTEYAQLVVRALKNNTVKDRLWDLMHKCTELIQKFKDNNLMILK